MIHRIIKRLLITFFFVSTILNVSGQQLSDSNANFLINVTSNNQKGGITAYQVFNNYYKTKDTIPDSLNLEYRMISDSLIIVAPIQENWEAPFISYPKTEYEDAVSFWPDGAGATINCSYLTKKLHLVIEKDKTQSELYYGNAVIEYCQSPSISRNRPLIIRFRKNIGFILFGDWNTPSKSFLYYNGKILYMPIRNH